MKHRHSVWARLSSSAVYLLIRIADRARNTAPAALLMAVMMIASGAWFAADTSAHVRGWKAWEKLFGNPEKGGAAAGPLAEPEGSTGAITITPIDEPDAGTTELMGTVALGVNTSGSVTGMYVNNGSDVHGYVRTAGGTFTSFDAPDAGSNPTSGRWSQGTVGIGVDTAGDVVGVYGDSKNAFHGFVREAGGTLTEFDDPNAPTTVGYRGTAALAINDSGAIAGFYVTNDQYQSSMMAYHGFLRSAGGSYITIDDPSAGTGAYEWSDQGTIAMALNASGQVAGTYVDSNNNQHGFIRSAAGAYTTIDVTGAATSCYGADNCDLTGTLPTGIDSQGDVVGSYTDANKLRHGFIRTAAGTITTFDAPGATTTAASGSISGTFPVTIDPTGSYIAGTYTDSSGLAHGFLYSQPLTAGASFATFSAPAAATSVTGLPLAGTLGFGVNPSGEVAGTYVDSNGGIHGFVAAPPATPSFTFSASPTSLTVNSGSQGTATLTVTPQGGFSSAVTFACSGLPAGASCTFASNPVTPAGSTAATTQLTIAVSAQSEMDRSGARPFFPAAALALLVCFAGWKRRRGVTGIWTLMVVAFGVATLASCGGGGSSPPPPPSTATVTVSATSGTIEQTATITLTVN